MPYGHVYRMPHFTAGLRSTACKQVGERMHMHVCLWSIIPGRCYCIDGHPDSVIQVQFKTAPKKTSEAQASKAM